MLQNEYDVYKLDISPNINNIEFQETMPLEWVQTKEGKIYLSSS